MSGQKSVCIGKWCYFQRLLFHDQYLLGARLSTHDPSSSLSVASGTQLLNSPASLTSPATRHHLLVTSIVSGIPFFFLPYIQDLTKVSDYQLFHR